MDTLTASPITSHRYDLEDLARVAYRMWADNKNVPAWERLPDFQRETWRRVARALFARISRPYDSLVTP